MFYQLSSPKKGDLTAVMKTSMGNLSIRLFPEEAPRTVENFVVHAKAGYYDNLKFHRIINNFMIQGGDPEGNGTGGQSIYGSPFKDEFSPRLYNLRGALSMANSGPNTNGSQFFITHVETPWLDGKHTVFGKVTKGLEVVDAIRQGDQIVSVKIDEK
jgi:cyclophilin family peptidyl-prolyl cis-trans isomerase